MMVIVMYCFNGILRVYNRPYVTEAEAKTDFERMNKPYIGRGFVTDIQYFRVGVFENIAPDEKTLGIAPRTVSEQIRNAYNASMDRLDNG